MLLIILVLPFVPHTNHARETKAKTFGCANTLKERRLVSTIRSGKGCHGVARGFPVPQASTFTMSPFELIGVLLRLRLLVLVVLRVLEYCSGCWTMPYR